ncbi:MAG: FAD-binding oxidoreductase [Polyangiales bacterium]
MNPDRDVDLPRAQHAPQPQAPGVRRWPFPRTRETVIEPRRRHPLRWAMFVVTVAGAAWLAGWLVTAPALPLPLTPVIVNDVTQLNPIPVTGITYPRSIAEVQSLVQSHPGPIAIGGGHYSMGGQTACLGCLALDTRALNKVLELDVPGKRVKVEAGIRWRQLQEAIDPHGLSISIMQTYANFSVGGSLSVNAHGRYVGGGPLVRSVEQIELVLADGTLVRASPQENTELFYAAIGGYGGVGVIVTATLRLADNKRVKRVMDTIDLATYARTFGRQVRDNTHVVFHNADLYAPDYDTVHTQSWVETDDPLTETDRLNHSSAPGRAGKLMLYWITELPFGHTARRYLYDTWAFHDDAVVMRNHEASYDVVELEPPSRQDTTYVLQEYFVPVAKLEAFVPKLRDVLNRYHVKVVNVSIRHALPDPGTLLAWAPEEVFSFVLYYKQGTTPEAKAEVATWTRAAIDAVLSVGGRYYLPYQPHATLSQLQRAYPGFDRYVALKRQVDPQQRFRNTLWDTYLPPQDAPTKMRVLAHSDAAALRGEGQTFLTLPEWYIVFSAEEYQRHLHNAAPSAFPFFGSTGQFWRLYRHAISRTRNSYPFNGEYHVMDVVIGLSYSLENTIKGVYENTIGRLTEAVACEGAFTNCNAEDAFAAQVAMDYDRFVRTYPWYQFPFAEKLAELWELDTSHNQSLIRSYERRLYLSAEYAGKALYAWLIGSASESAYGVSAETTRVWLTRSADAPRPAKAREVGRADDEEVLDLPRYEGFRDALAELDPLRSQLRQVAGNERIAVSVVIPRAFALQPNDGALLLTRWPILTDPHRDRALLFVPVDRLLGALAGLRARGAEIDHVFDF